MGKDNRFYIQFLREELDKRIKKNPAYSLRAFAKSLGIDPSYLAKTLSRKQHFSLEIAEKVTKKLKLDEETRKEFFKSVVDGKMCRSLHKIDPKLTDCD